MRLPVRLLELAGRVVALALFAVWFCASTAGAALVLCDEDDGAVVAAMYRMRNAVDPCGQSSDLQAVLDKVERCGTRIYNVCTDPTARRNIFDQPISSLGHPPRSITWNPLLRTEIDDSCSANAEEPLLRDPTSSLLHELVHAAQDCDGLNPGEHELAAVRIENIYRRAVGLCQRPGYGDDPLPSSMVVRCPMRPCSCSAPTPHGVEPQDAQLAHSNGTASDRLGQISGDRPSD